ncbi:MAG: hypothetical protein PHU23_10395 [Dehalococcoidales bacterium]|nr:hypothetical protein [Dehalococcoidales bacterium]
MPIKGISEVIRLPRLGKIRLGIKKDGEGTPYPEPTDHFVCPEEVKKVFGEKPRELRIMFPTNDPAQWASQYLRCYSESRRLMCRGNGKIAVAKVSLGIAVSSNLRDTELKEIPCNPAGCEAYQQGLCRRVMNLQFLLPDCPGFGVYQLDTSSYHSMVNINSSLELIYNICRRYAMIPLSLQLVEKEVQPEGHNKTAWVLNLAPTYSLIETQRYAQMPPEQVLVLPPPDSEAPDDLFPEEILKQEKLTKRSPEEEELLALWDKAKKKVWQLDMQEYQVAHYFMKSYHLGVGLKDFNSPLPPTKFTAEMLREFLQNIERHTRFS